jgi:hypothetical protein
MFENSLPYDQGLKHNIIINPRNIFYRDPRDVIVPKPIIIIGKPNVSKDKPPSQIAKFSMKPVDAYRIDPKHRNNKNIIVFGKPDTRKISFLDAKNKVSTSDSSQETSETKTKPTFQIYSKIIRQLYTVMLPDLLKADMTLLNNAYENFQKEYVKNKSKMTDNLLDFLIKNYISSVRSVFEKWYNESDKTINPILTLETGVPLDDIQNNNDDLYQLLIDNNENKNKQTEEELDKEIAQNLDELKEYQQDLDQIEAEEKEQLTKLEEEKEKIRQSLIEEGNKEKEKVELLYQKEIEKQEKELETVKQEVEKDIEGYTIRINNATRIIEEHKIIKQQNDKKITEIESKLKTPGIDSKEEKSLIAEMQKLIDASEKIDDDDKYYKISIIDYKKYIKEAEKALGIKDKQYNDKINEVVEEQKTVDAKIKEKVEELEKDILKTAEEKRREKRKIKKEISKNRSDNMTKQNEKRKKSKEANKQELEKEKEKKQAAGTISESRLVDMLQFIRETSGEISYDPEKLNLQYRAALKNNFKEVEGISIDRKILVFDRNKENFLKIVRFDVYSRIYDDIKGNTLVEKQMKKKFNARYKKITKTEPEDFYYIEYLIYAKERFNRDNPPLSEDPLSLDLEDQGSSSGPKTIRESGTVRAKEDPLSLDLEDQGSSSGPKTVLTNSGKESKFSFSNPINTPNRKNLALASTFSSPYTGNLTGLGQKHKLSKSLKQLLKKYNL